MIHPDVARLEDFTLASPQQLGHLFAGGAGVALQYGDCSHALPNYTFEPFYQGDVEFVTGAHKKRMFTKASDTIMSLGLVGMLDIAATGTVRQQGFSRTFEPTQCVFFVDLEPPYKTGLYCRAYRIAKEEKGLRAYSLILEDCMPILTAEQQEEIWMLDELTGQITRSEYRALRQLTSTVYSRERRRQPYRRSYTELIMSDVVASS